MFRGTQAEALRAARNIQIGRGPTSASGVRGKTGGLAAAGRGPNSDS